LKTYGTGRLGAIITRTCALAGYLEARILAEPQLELLAPVQLNIVCFRYRAADANEVNRNIVIDIQESGIAAPSTTVLDGQLAIRAAIVNHRTDTRDIDALITAVLDFGTQRSHSDDGLVLKVEQSPPLAM
jgi:glutamate/tyrosine decarboxylase-like PLP-dependent enzyme